MHSAEKGKKKTPTKTSTDVVTNEELGVQHIVAAECAVRKRCVNDKYVYDERMNM